MQRYKEISKPPNFVTQIILWHTDMQFFKVTQISQITQILSPLIRDGYKAGIIQGPADLSVPVNREAA